MLFYKSLFPFLAVLLAFAAGGPRIDAPKAAETVQGRVNIVGSTQVDGFESAEVAFAYDADVDGSWFLIQQSSQPVSQGVLASWDTTTIADGAYRLRVKVFLKDGRSQEAVVTGLKVHNYTQADGQVGLTPAAQALLLPTPTPLPQNPAAFSGLVAGFHALSGVLFVLVLFGLFGLYLGLRNLFRGR